MVSSSSSDFVYDNPIIDELFACIRTLQAQVVQLQKDVEYLKIYGGSGGIAPDTEEESLFLLEDGGLFQLENGSGYLRFESKDTSSLTLEDGSDLLLENGAKSCIIMGELDTETLLGKMVYNIKKHPERIKKMIATETAGAVSVICSDKTGTLTQNKMTVVESFTEDEVVLASAMALSSDAELNEDGTVTGEPTEAALVYYALSRDLNKNDLKVKYPRVAEVPFDSNRMLSFIPHLLEIVFVKSAPMHIFNLGLYPLMLLISSGMGNGAQPPMLYPACSEISQPLSFK